MARFLAIDLVSNGLNPLSDETLLGVKRAARLLRFQAQESHNVVKFQ